MVLRSRSNRAAAGLTPCSAAYSSTASRPFTFQRYCRLIERSTIADPPFLAGVIPAPQGSYSQGNTSPGQGERIQARAQGLQLGGVRGRNLRAGEHALQRGQRRIVAAPDASAHARLATELDGGQEQVLEPAQLAAVERVDRGLGGGSVVAHVPEQLADVGPVLLLDVGVVVLLVGAAAGELDLLGLTVVPQMLIDKLRAVIRVDPAEPKR